MNVTAPPIEHLVSIQADDLEWIADETERIAERAYRIEVFVDRLRGLADPSVLRLELPIPREHLRDWIDELAYLSYRIKTDAGWMSNGIREALDGRIWETLPEPAEVFYIVDGAGCWSRQDDHDAGDGEAAS